jgi:ATP phosphoribosyltransferase
VQEQNWVAVGSMVEKNQTAAIMDKLVNVGAEDILIFNLDNCIV